MKIQPRQQLLDIWRAMARVAFPDGTWIWGGRDGRNSISDAEQLLCIMGPATEIPTFKLDAPDETAEDVLEALRPLGDSVEIPRRLVRIITEYLTTYTDESGAPIFSGGTYFRENPEDPQEPTDKQRELDVVDSFAVSVRLMLATIGFAQVFRRQITRDDLRREVDTLASMAGVRLTAAIVGLLRSFSVYTFEFDSKEAGHLGRMVNQGAISPARRVLDELNVQLREINASLRYLTLGSGPVPDLDNPNRLFEIGWSWGITQDALEIETADRIGKQRDGVALAAPYLYFTVIALESIQDLFSERTRVLGLLTDEQQRLARALQLRWDLTQSYWSKLARFGSGQWPVEDLPWRTNDGIASDYLSLLVVAILVQDLNLRRGSREDLLRINRVLSELAERARIIRRTVVVTEPAVALHSPGFPNALEGTEEAGGARLTWRISDFTPQLLKRVIRVAGQFAEPGGRGELIALADQIWEKHLVPRRQRGDGQNRLWDQPEAIYPEVPVSDSRPSWYYTERVIGCLVAAADLVASRPIRSPHTVELATDLLAEADHLFDQELLKVSAEAGPAMGSALHTVRTTLRRAHETIGERPGTAYVLAAEVLRELDRLAVARQSRYQGT